MASKSHPFPEHNKFQCNPLMSFNGKQNEKHHINNVSNTACSQLDGESKSFILLLKQLICILKLTKSTFSSFPLSFRNHIKKSHLNIYRNVCQPLRGSVFITTTMRALGGKI